MNINMEGVYHTFTTQKIGSSIQNKHLGSQTVWTRGQFKLSLHLHGPKGPALHRQNYSSKINIC
jgi:hypothetical protein